MNYFNPDDETAWPQIPHDLFMCPICGDFIEFVEINEYETKTGIITEEGFHVNCVAAPDEEDWDSQEYDDFDSSHWSMPYVDWLPLEHKIYLWLRDNYRVAKEYR